jgi:signal transduction histidine kinase
MNRSWIFNAVAVAVIVVLTAFLGLQYYWLRQASDASQERLQRRIVEDANRLADDFNKEMQSAYFNFQADPDRLLSNDASELAERYDYWFRSTEFTDLVQRIDMIPTDPAGTVSTYDAGSRSLLPASDDPSLTPIIDRIRADEPPPLTLDGEHVLIVPLHPSEKLETRVLIRRKAGLEEPPIRMPKPPAYAAVSLDPAVIREKILPALARRRFLLGDVHVSIDDRNGATIYQTGTISGNPDAAAPLFDLTPDNLIFFSQREAMPKRERSSTIINQRVEKTLIDSSVAGETKHAGEMFTFELKEGDGKRRSAVVSGELADRGPWTLKVQHVDGSVGQFISNERNRSLAIGIGIYLLLAGSIIAIVVSSNRSRTFAQRQVDFVSSVSHEFRTPLAVIYSAAENLADGVARDQTQISRYGDLIKGEGKKLSGMVEQILEFAGARSGRRQYHFGEADLAEITRSTLDEMRPAIAESGFELDVETAERLHLQRVDREAVSAAIKNLVQNSIKYSNGSRWIRVSASNGQGSVKISVEDKGIGVARSEQKKIFEPFYRAPRVVDEQIHGNGLGLSLVKDVAEAHGGSVRVESEPGKGSKFTLEFPQSR